MMMQRSDIEIAEEINQKLISDPNRDKSKILFFINEGRVVLQGTISSSWEEYIVKFAAKSTEGVKEVVNGLNIDVADRSKRSDTDIENSSIAALYWDANVPKNAIQVNVKDGYVTLTGKVDSWSQCHSAENAIRHFTEVKGIKNLIEVNSTL